MTQFERIKGMDIDEMALFIFANFQTDEWFNPIVEDQIMFHENDVKEWLESEVDTE